MICSECKHADEQAHWTETKRGARTIHYSEIVCTHLDHTELDDNGGGRVVCRVAPGLPVFAPVWCPIYERLSPGGVERDTIQERQLTGGD